MRKIFFNARGLRAGWRLLIFMGMFVGLGYLADWLAQVKRQESN